MSQSTEKEMLELAAKAAGYSHLTYLDHQCKDGQVVTGHYEPLSESCINPLTDDGDALRLAVNLGIGFQSYQRLGYSVATAELLTNSILTKEPHNTSDQYAATRRAIVRAAAEIGLLLTTVEPRNSPKRG